jgi:hypothetical protein
MEFRRVVSRFGTVYVMCLDDGDDEGEGEGEKEAPVVSC